MNEFGMLLRSLREKDKETQSKLANILGITPQMVSKLEMGKNKPSMDILKRLAQHFDVSTQFLLGLEKNENKSPVMLPVIGEIAAGQHLFAQENIVGQLPEIPGAHGDFYLQVRGNSMEPLIRDGATVLIGRNHPLNRGNIGAFIVNGENALIKRFYPDSLGVVLRSDNPDFEPMFFDREKWDRDCRIIGKVLKVILDIQ